MAFTLATVLASPDLLGLGGIQIVRQTQPDATAAACAATALRYCGQYASETMVMDMVRSQESQSGGKTKPGIAPGTGCLPEQLIRVFADKGLLASGYHHYPVRKVLLRTKMGLATLVRVPDRAQHWIIPVGIEPIMGAIVLADPSRGATSFTVEPIGAFEKAWSDEHTVIEVQLGEKSKVGHAQQKRGRIQVVSYAGLQERVQRWQDRQKAGAPTS